MKPKHIHCIGIGGIGVSALARFYKALGWRVTGSDLARSEITNALRREGIRVFIGPHRQQNVKPLVTNVVYTAAVAKKLLYSFHDRRKSTTKSGGGNRGDQTGNQIAENPEIREARRRGIPAMSYAEAVGELTREFKTIAIAGAHGKSTTTALIALTLIRAGLDPTVIVGTKLRELKNSNFRPSLNLLKSDFNRFDRLRQRWLVIEADEYRASFLNYRPDIAVVTNIDREHLDFYKNIGNIEAAFLKFLLRLRPDGVAVLNRDDPRLRRMGLRLRRARPDCRIVWYSLRNPKAKKIEELLRIPGRHNVSNALAACAVGRVLKIQEKEILSALHSYRGAWRRFDYQGQLFGAKVYADYAHHPTEIKATLQAAREKFPRSRIWCVFQPHHYERTRDLFSEFVKAFDDCDALILLDIYEVAGREQKRRLSDTNSAKLAEHIRRRGIPALYLPDPKRLKPFLAEWLRPGDVLLMMGAGSIWEMTKQLTKSKFKVQKSK